MANASILTTLIVPLIATLICNAMWLAPLPAVQEARKTKTMHGLNPVPFVMTIFNCFGWMLYAIEINDYFIFFSNIAGLVLGVYYTISSLILLSLHHEKHQIHYETMEKLILGAVFFWEVISLLIGFVVRADPTTTAFITACSANVFTLVFYIAPIKTIVQVIHDRNSSILYPPMVLTTLMNSGLWFVYGIAALDDFFVYVPNGIGATLSLIQLILIPLYTMRGQAHGEFRQMDSPIEEEAAGVEEGGAAGEEGGDKKDSVVNPLDKCMHLSPV